MATTKIRSGGYKQPKKNITHTQTAESRIEIENEINKYCDSDIAVTVTTTNSEPLYGLIVGASDSDIMVCTDKGNNMTMNLICAIDNIISIDEGLSNEKQA
jgi:hypothetical protein